MIMVILAKVTETVTVIEKATTKVTMIITTIMITARDIKGPTIAHEYNLAILSAQRRFYLL